jgi:Glycosyltransferase WbsX
MVRLPIPRLRSEFISDSRYIKIDGRPLIMLYRAGHLPDARASTDRWRQVFLKAGFPNPYIVMAQAFGDNDHRVFGFDGAAGFPPHGVGAFPRNICPWMRLFDQTFVGKVFSYDKIAARGIANAPGEFRLFPGVCPDWDIEARRTNRGHSLAGSTPKEYGKWLRTASETALKVPTRDERIVFINAWNEWAEGAYLEPDTHYGCAYLLETLKVLESLSLPRSETYSSDNRNRAESPYESPRSSPLNFLRNLPHVIARAGFANTVQWFVAQAKSRLRG